ncbi:DNA-binding SARP family transcriptional activator [Paucibacter oligotrophus]|uniref:DNA-binding SARP family transcriptional activator n=1 Tax=Roseateles oligotrophus TaxID=1769250 RepID=A0A840LCI0_9BURK|nr:BTAD domain-containing putative transcriptional regulator [Roseateles oligotrophus]MBB4845870.1 DNA-binding SARP family transcriptional activator [Roseateles oligotrophus]
MKANPSTEPSKPKVRFELQVYGPAQLFEWTAGSAHAYPAKAELRPMDAALLALLLIDGPQDRTQIAHLFWPEQSASMALSNLRQRITRLNRRVPAQRLLQGQTRLSASPELQLTSPCWERLPAQETEFLQGLRFEQQPRLNDWIQIQRSKAMAEQTQQLQGAISLCEAKGELGQALALLQRLHTLHPSDEAVLRRLMRALTGAGRQQELRQAFEHSLGHLRAEQGRLLSNESAALYLQLKAKLAGDTSLATP